MDHIIKGLILHLLQNILDQIQPMIQQNVKAILEKSQIILIGTIRGPGFFDFLTEFFARKINDFYTSSASFVY